MIIERKAVERKAIELRNTCYQCHRQYSKPYTLKRHYSDVHGISLPNRNNTTRPLSKTYDYVESAGSVHHACNACFFHTPSLEKFVEHVKKEHQPKKISLEPQVESRQKVRVLARKMSKKKRHDPVEDLANEAMKIIIKKLGSLMAD